MKGWSMLVCKFLVWSRLCVPVGVVVESAGGRIWPSGGLFDGRLSMPSCNANVGQIQVMLLNLDYFTFD